jgi:antitoxin (DNA-binding transcriptional repressor) of toxin-antitoxin stability system
MRSVKVSQLKTHLSRYLRLVRQGEEVIVKDRETSVAKIIPLTRDSLMALVVEPATRPAKELAKLEIPPAASPAIDSLSALLEERRKR